MVGAQDQCVVVRRDQGLLLLGMVSPQHEHLGLGGVCNVLNQRIGDGFPTPAGMRSGFPGFYGQDGIQQQYALFCPAFQVVGLHGELIGKLARDLGEDIAQAGRARAMVWNAERQPLCLAGAVVGILSQNNDANGFRGQVGQRPEGVSRENNGPFIQSLCQKYVELLKGRVYVAALQGGLPVLWQVFRVAQQISPECVGRQSGRHINVRVPVPEVFPVALQRLREGQRGNPAVPVQSG